MSAAAKMTSARKLVPSRRSTQPASGEQVMSANQSTVEYRTLPEHDGYRVGSDGSVWSCWQKFGILGKGGAFSIKTSQWKRLSGSLNQDGYLRVKIKTASGSRIERLVHQLVLFAFVGPRPAGCESCHNNGIKTDNRRENLRWGTPSENQQDAVRHGTRKTGITSAGLDFIRKWNAAETLSAFCAKTGKTRRRAVSLASSYRCQGHHLKLHRRGQPRVALVGERFGKWVVLSIRGCYRLCRCDCGQTRLVCASSLRTGVSKSCSCSRKRTNARGR